jgi:hypothetical protein
MKKNRGDKPIGIIKHIYMEISQGNSLGSYLYLKQAKMYFFPLQNQRTRGLNRFCRGVVVVVVVISGRWKMVGKGYRRVNMVQILCTHLCK